MTNLMIIETKFKINAITGHVLCKEGKFVFYVNKELYPEEKTHSTSSNAMEWSTSSVDWYKIGAWDYDMFVQPLLQWKNIVTYSKGVLVTWGIQHAQYNHLWPVRLYRIFPNCIIKGTIFEERLLNIKYAFSFSLNCSSETFFILRMTERDVVINVYWSAWRLPVILVRF